jgi:hypothetical protein
VSGNIETPKKEKSWYIFWIFAIIGSSFLGVSIFPLTGSNYILSLIGSISLLYAGYNLGRVL